jgi:hypothetical protein
MKTIVNCTTGEIVNRELNKKELEQKIKDETFMLDKERTKQAEAEAKETARQALLTKLGITAEEAQLLLGGN